MSEHLTTGPFNGGYEFEYHDSVGTRCYMHIYEDGRIAMSLSVDGTGYGVILPDGAVSVLRDLILQVIPLPQEAIAR